MYMYVSKIKIKQIHDLFILFIKYNKVSQLGCTQNKNIAHLVFYEIINADMKVMTKQANM